MQSEGVPGPRAGQAATHPPPWRVIGAFVLGALGIAFSAIFVRLALPAPPVVTGFYRMLFALLPLGLLVWLRREEGHSTRAGVAWAALAGTFLGTDLALWHTAVVGTSVANATLLVNTTPIPVGIYSAWVLRERPGAAFLVGTAFALLGTTLLLGSDRDLGATGLTGDGLALAAALFYAAYLILMKRVRRGVDALRGTLAATGGAVAAMGIYALLRGDPFAGFPAQSWWAFLGAAWISQLGGVLGIVWGLRWLRATFASVTLLVQPLGTALLGWILLGEAIGPLQALGGAALLAGIFVASRAGLDPNPGASPGGTRCVP